MYSFVEWLKKRDGVVSEDLAARLQSGGPLSQALAQRALKTPDRNLRQDDINARIQAQALAKAKRKQDVLKQDLGQDDLGQDDPNQAQETPAERELRKMGYPAGSHFVPRGNKTYGYNIDSYE